MRTEQRKIMARGKLNLDKATMAAQVEKLAAAATGADAVTAPTQPELAQALADAAGVPLATAAEYLAVTGVDVDAAGARIRPPGPGNNLPPGLVHTLAEAQADAKAAAMAEFRETLAQAVPPEIIAAAAVGILAADTVDQVKYVLGDLEKIRADKFAAIDLCTTCAQVRAL